jgi:hypothetical protein
MKCGVPIVEYLFLTEFVKKILSRQIPSSIRVGTYEVCVPIVEYLFLTAFVTHFCLH